MDVVMPTMDRLRRRGGSSRSCLHDGVSLALVDELCERLAHILEQLVKLHGRDLDLDAMG
jgi:hypothetical protein